MMNSCFLRVDANKKIGYGHLSRCRIIADELIKNKIKPVFLVHDTDASILKLLSDQNYEYRILQADDPQEIISSKNLYKAQKYLLIFDTDIELYYNKETQHDLISAGFKLVYFTFWDQYLYYAHIIINQNPLSLTHHYQTADHTKKLLGPDYMIFDNQFVDASGIGSEQGNAKAWDFFLSFGGTDIPDTTAKTIKALELLDINIRFCNVVIGALYQNERRLYDLIDNCPFECRIFKQIPNISDIMQQSNIAISSGGLTLWELAVMNVPTAVISYSDREKITADHLDNRGWTYHMGSADQLDPLLLSEKIRTFISSEDLMNRTKSLRDIININGKQNIVKELILLLDE